METVRLVVPLGSPAAELDVPPLPEVTRVSDGSVVTFLDNTKPNARQLLDLVATAVREQHRDMETVVLRKAINTSPADAALLDLAAPRARLFVTGIGD